MAAIAKVADINARVVPFQVPGSSVMPRAQGPAPDVTSTICVRDVTTTYKF